MDKIKEWYYESQSKKSTGGLIFLCVAGAALVGVWAWMFLN